MSWRGDTALGNKWGYGATFSVVTIYYYSKTVQWRCQTDHVRIGITKVVTMLLRATAMVVARQFLQLDGFSPRESYRPIFCCHCVLRVIGKQCNGWA
eukprot:3223754-Amphidinium_carterae.1